MIAAAARDMGAITTISTVPTQGEDINLSCRKYERRSPGNTETNCRGATAIAARASSPVSAIVAILASHPIVAPLAFSAISPIVTSECVAGISAILTGCR